MPIPHRKVDETPGWWFKQIDRAREVFRKTQERHHRTQLRRMLDLDVPEIMLSTHSDEVRDQKDAPPGSEQIDINYIYRYALWVHSQTFDRHPEILYPRYAGSDAQTGDMAAQLLTRVGDECRETEAWEGTISEAICQGAFAVWYGIHADVVDQTMLHDVSKPVGQLAAEAASEMDVPRKGQDHREAATVFRDQALGGEDPQTQLDAEVAFLKPGGEVRQERLVEAADERLRAQQQEDKKAQDWRFQRNAVWCRFSPVGTHTLWEPRDCVSDSRWICRIFAQDIDIVKDCEAYKPRVRHRVEPGHYIPPEEMEYAEAWQDKEPGTDVWIYEIWDRKYSERHYLVRGLDVFLEADPHNPYTWPDGRPMFHDFAPVVIEAPVKPPKANAQRPHGVPIAAPAWPLQRAAIKFLSYNMEAVKKLGPAMWEYDEEVDDDTLTLLQSGELGRGVKRPVGLRDTQRRIVEPIEFGNVSPEIFQQFLICEQKVALLLAWPISQMTGQPVADTATAEQISVTAGHEQLGAFIRSMENAYAKGQEIKRALIMRYYKDAQIEDLIGTDLLPLWRIFKSSPVHGDRIRARFQARVEGEDAVRKKQVGDVFQASLMLKDPLTGIPLVKPEEIFRIFQEWVRLNGLGKVERFEPDEAMLESLLGLAGGGGNGQEGKKSAEHRGEKPPSQQQFNAAAQKVGPRSGPGRGMF